MAESTSSQKENERLLTGKPTFRFSLATSGIDPKQTSNAASMGEERQQRDQRSEHCWPC